MRSRVVSNVLIGLGVFALVAALAIKLFLVSSLVKLPLANADKATDPLASPSATATDVRYFDVASGEQRRAVSATASQTVLGVPDAADADGDTAVWASGTVIKDDATGTVINAGGFQTCLDRTTAVAVADCSSALGWDNNTGSGPGAAPTGLTLNFPLDTQKKTYQLYNPQTGKAWPAEYAATEKIRGTTVYRFETDVQPTVLTTLSVSSALVGQPAGEQVQADVVYSSHRTVWVEPTTGVVITATEVPDVYYQGADGSRGVTVLSGTFVGTDQTITAQLKQARDNRSQIVGLSTVIPLVLLVVGVLALVFGLLLARRAGRSLGAHREAPVEEAPPSVLQES